MTKLSSMRNIGKTIEEKLKSVGIGSAEELVQIGSKEAFSRLRAKHPHSCLVLLYSLQGAIDNVEYNKLPPEVKQDLKNFINEIEINSSPL